MLEKEIDTIDGALWGICLSEDGSSIGYETTLYKFNETKRKVSVNEDLGSYKYNVFSFKPTEAEQTIEFMKAHIGDVARFIKNYASAGYNGIIVKDGCVPKKTIKDLIRVTCKSFDVPEKALKPILSQV